MEFEAYRKALRQTRGKDLAEKYRKASARRSLPGFSSSLQRESWDSCTIHTFRPEPYSTAQTLRAPTRRITISVARARQCR